MGQVGGGGHVTTGGQVGQGGGVEGHVTTGGQEGQVGGVGQVDVTTGEVSAHVVGMEEKF